MSLKQIRRALVGEMIGHARAASPEECCGLVGGRGGEALSVYPLRNAALLPETTYEAAPEDLFAAQRRMRERGESLLAIYHSHPRSEDPVPSERDVRLAFYPEAVYFIIGFTRGGDPVVGSFRIFEGEGRWERADVSIVEGRV